MRLPIDLIVLAPGLAVLICGCADKPKFRPVHPVHGTITFQGKPVSGASINFFGVDEGLSQTFVSAKTDENGGYKLTTYAVDDGAPEGDFVVVITWPEPDAKRTKAADPSAEAEPSQDRFKGAYASKAKSPLKATVKQGPNEIDFKLP